MDDLEREVTRTLTDVADKVTVPPVDISAIVLNGRRESRAARTRGLWYGAASVAAVALVIAGTTVGIRWASSGTSGSHSDIAGQPPSTTPTVIRPESVTALASGPQTSVPYWSGGVLHLGAATVEMASQPVLKSINGSSLVVENPAAADMSIAVVQGTQIHTLGTGAATSYPVISSDGRFAAWETASSKPKVTLHMWNLESGAQVASKTFVSRQVCCTDPSVPVGIDAQGRVYIDDGGYPMVWNTVTGTIQGLTGLVGSSLYGANTEGPLAEDTSAAANKGLLGATVFGTVDSSGAFHRIGRLPGQSESWSPAGAYFAYQNVSGGVIVRNAAGDKVALGLPLGASSLSVWESPNVLMVTRVEGAHTYWVRCEVTTGACEIADTLPTGSNLVLPEPN